MRAANPLQTGSDIAPAVTSSHCCLLDSQMVWGDLKLEHFLVFSGLPLIVKAVDFDAAVSFGERLTDAFSPRYAPPERAKLISQQRKGAAAAATLIAHPSYDSELVCLDRLASELWLDCCSLVSGHLLPAAVGQRSSLGARRC